MGKSNKKWKTECITRHPIHTSDSSPMHYTTDQSTTTKHSSVTEAAAEMLDSSNTFVLTNYNKRSYTADLTKLNSCRPTKAITDLPEDCKKITTPLMGDNWVGALEGHQDRQFVAYIVEGINSGFRLGVDYDKKFKSAKSNITQGHGKFPYFLL